MIVNIAGVGKVRFPDTMEEAEVRAILRQFERNKEPSMDNKVLEVVQKALSSQRPTIVTEVKVVEVEKQVIVKEPVLIEKESESDKEAMGWHFQIERDENGITDIYAEPYSID